MMQATHWIGGQDASGEGPSIPIVNPSTGAPIGALAEATPPQVTQAAEAARASFEAGAWANAPIAERRAKLREIAEAIRAAADELVDLQVTEGGMIPGAVRGHIAGAAGWFDYFADFLTTVGEEAYGQIPGATTLVERVPIGVCALFSPWNVPVGLTAIKLAPALAAGNSVVVKPSEETPLTARRLIDLVAGVGLPDGVVNLVNGRGAVTGAALAEHPDVDMISYTGGSAGARAVGQAAARRHVPCVMELGGKSATIVFADADLDKAIEGAALSVFSNNGEACLAGSRILVEEAIADDFIARFRAYAEGLKVGAADSEGTFCGPMISAQHRDRVLGFYETDDEVLFGGALEGDGFFVRPGAIRVASSASRVWREEVFGPLAAIATFSDEDEAIAMANESDYGLSGYLWTNDLGRAHRVAKSLRTGTVIVNSTFLRELNAPFGGFKASGIGREGGLHSWHNVTQARTTVIRHG